MVRKAERGAGRGAGGRGLMLTRRAFVALGSAAFARGDHADLHGIRLHYDSLGKGPRAVVLIHGWSCNGAFWKRNTPALAARQRVLVVDLPGHGQSEKPESLRYTIDLFADAVIEVLRAAGVTRAVLAGHSMGTPVARQVLRKRPDLGEGFIAVDGVMPRLPDTREEQEKAEAQWREFAKPFRSPDYRKSLEGMLKFMFSEATTPELREEIGSQMAATPQYVMASAMEHMRESKYHAPDRIAVPALAIYAKQTRMAADAEAYVRGFIPNLEWQVWDGVGHFLMMEKPEEFNRAVLAFLDRLPKK